jgi:hypothetical protein
MIVTWELYLIRSERWKFISEESKEAIGLTQEDDGEFWYVDTNVLS